MAAAGEETRRAALDTLLGELDAAGYHRARLPLSAFDRCVGGLCWALAASGLAGGTGGAAGVADVSELFQENLDVGQRIRLSEEVVRALRAAQCPHPLQAHQLHGGDFEAMLPVVRWLLAQVIATRRVAGDVVRAQSELQFSKAAAGAWGEPLVRAVDALEGDYKGSAALLQRVRERYLPRRRYRIDQASLGSAQLVSEETRVRAVLLEFGERASQQQSLFGLAQQQPQEQQQQQQQLQSEPAAESLDALPVLARSAGKGSFENQYDAMLRQASAERQASLERALELEGRLRLIPVEHAASPLEGDKPELQLGAHAQAVLARSLGQGAPQRPARRPAGSASALTAASATSLATLQSRVAAEQARAERAAQLARDVCSAAAAAEVQLAAEVADVAHGQSKVEALRRKAEAAAAACSTLASEEPAGAGPALARLRELVGEHERLKATERAFRAECKQQALALQGALDAAAQVEGPAREAEEATVAAADRALHEASQQHARVVLELAEVNQRAAALHRVIDDVPTRAELVQYEKRFVELYSQLAHKLEENRRVVTTYNTLETTLELLTKENSLLQSVCDGAEAALRSNRSRDEFLAQFRAILQGLTARKEQMLRARDASAAARDAAERAYLAVVDSQRRYFGAVKEFQLECERNAALGGSN
jgi:hypothetical protein